MNGIAEISNFLKNTEVIAAVVGAALATFGGVATSLFIDWRRGRNDKRERLAISWRTVELAIDFMEEFLPSRARVVLTELNRDFIQGDMAVAYDHLSSIRPNELMQQTSEPEILYAILLKRLKLASRLRDHDDHKSKITDIRSIIDESKQKFKDYRTSVRWRWVPDTILNLFKKK